MNDILEIIKKKRGSFGFNGNEYKYFIHKYNKTWRNERCVEIPIVKNFLKNPFEKILEVGNVTKNYFKNNHIVIDKYEKGPEVINKDILKFFPQENYDKIVAISTIEHVGEDIQDPTLAIDAIEHLKSLLTDTGEMIITFPAGFNTLLEENIFDMNMKVYGLKKLDNGNWKECDPEKLKGVEYDFDNHTALGLYICIFEKRP